MTDIESTVCGIPCLIRVLHWEPYTPPYLGGPPEHCYPAEGGYGAWEILDRKGKPAPWLENKLTEQERNRIIVQVFNHMES
jgi:hypothetical protein